MAIFIGNRIFFGPVSVCGDAYGGIVSIPEQHWPILFYVGLLICKIRDDLL